MFARMFFPPMNSPPPGRRSHSWTPCFGFFFSSSSKLIGNMRPDSHRKTAAVVEKEGGSGGVPERFACFVVYVCAEMAGTFPRPRSSPPSLRLRSSADTWLASRNQAVAANIRGVGEGGGSKLWMCQHFYFLHHKARLDTNNGTHWQPFRKTMRGKWATANPGLYANPPATV